jgi:tRNA-splicing ligase RtcB
MFIRKIEKVIPMGLGRKHRNSASLPALSVRQAGGKTGSSLEEVIDKGARYVVEEGFGTPDDLKFCEEGGAIGGADISKLSKKSLSRARGQIGTLGSGNHFLELQKIERIYDKKTAGVFGLKENLVCFMIHSGSRALGHQTCIDYTNLFVEENREEKPELVPVKNLASALVNSQVGKDYLAAMNGAINFAFANRQMMAYQFRKVFTKFMESLGVEVSVELIYDVAHNSAKWEIHKGKKVLVHRKGATRALPPNHTDNPTAYMNVGHPAFVPGSMGTASYVLVGTEKANETYFSVNHGAGRAMSRTEAKRTIKKEDFERQMEGIVFNKPYRIVADEAPAAYKNVEDVIDSLEEIGITKKVAKLVPLAVMKGD